MIAKHAPLIARAMPHIGHPAIRNRGTLGGSIAFADPAAELPACLLALDGEIDATRPEGQAHRQGATISSRACSRPRSAPQDVLTAIRVPAADKDTRVGFAELARRHGDYAMVGLAASARADGKGLADVRLAYFGVGATPVRAKKAEAALAERQYRRRGRRARSRSARRRAGDRRGEKTSRRRAAPPRGQAVDGGAAMSDHALDITLTVNGERVQRARRSAQDAGRFPARGPWPHRQPCRLRARRLRRLHRAGQRRDRARLPDAGGAMRRRQGRDHRGPVGFRRDRRSAGGVRAAQRPAMRLLHARHARCRAGPVCKRGGVPSRDEIREHLSGNYCRCTGYHAIVDAVEAVAQARAGAKK